MSVAVKDSIDGTEFQESENIAFDIETEGFAGGNGDEVTILGFHPDSTKDDSLFLVNIQDKDIDKREIWEELNILPVHNTKIVFYTSEFDLLDKGFRKLIEGLDDYDQRLYGYNAETWGGGFDFPFLRTRFIYHDINWYLDGFYYADCLNEVQNHINTVEPLYSSMTEDEQEEFKSEYNYTDEDINKNQHTTKELEDFGKTHNVNIFGSSNGLDEAHEVLCDCGVDDPYESSKQAVEDFEDGNIAPVIYHCYTDVVRTKCLFDLVMEYTPAREPNELKDSGYL